MSRSESKSEKLLTTILKGMTTTRVKIKYSNIYKPFYYPNSPQIPRYSITLLLDPLENKTDIEALRKIEKSEAIKILKADGEKNGDEFDLSGKFILKLQTKEKVPVFLTEGDKKSEIEINSEIPINSILTCQYDILRYTKKGVSDDKYGLTCKLISIEILNNGNS